MNGWCLAGLTLAGVLAACGDSGPYDESDPIVLEPYAVWGELTGPEEEQFGRVIAFDADSAGLLYVADDHAKTIEVRDADGKLRWVAGGPGEGPGEFERVVHLGVGYGQVYAADGYAARLTVLDASDGALVGTAEYEVPNWASYASGALRVLSPDSVSFGTLELVAKPDDRYPMLPRSSVEAQVVVSRKDGLVRRTPIPQPSPERFLIDRPNAAPRALRLPFMPWNAWAVTPEGGLISAWGAGYRIASLGEDGDTLRTFGRDVPPRRKERVQKLEAREWVMGAVRPYLGVEEARSLELPEVQQQVTGLFYSRDGTMLWVRRNEQAPSPTYDVLSPAGEYRCTVTLEVERGNAGYPSVPLRVVNGRAFQVFLDEEYDASFVAAFEVPDQCRG